MNDNVTLVISTFNSENMLKRTLKENLNTGFKQIVIVDGESTDNTDNLVYDFQQQYPHKIKLYSVPKKGLANARNYGTSKVEDSEYTMHAGPDNFLPDATVKQMVEHTKQYDLVSCQTFLHESHSYLEKAHNCYKKRYMEGEQEVVGTPYLAKTTLFKEFPFNENMLNSDDTEFCHRLKQAKKTIYRSAVVCYEIGFNDLANIVERWMRWGRGDALFHKEMQHQWTFSRKIQSWLYPMRAELIMPSKALPTLEYMYIFPFLLFTMYLRYLGRLKYLVLKK